MTAPSLPQNDPNPAARRAALEDARKAWHYGTWEDLHAFAAGTPVDDLPRLGWIVKLVPGLLGVLLNTTTLYLLRCLGRLDWTSHAGRQAVRSQPAPLLAVIDTPDKERGTLTRARSSAWRLAYRLVDYRLRQTLGNYGTTAAPSRPAPPPPAQPPRKRPDVTLADFIRLYSGLPLPPIVRDWQSAHGGLTDATFAWLRLAGPNPEMISGVDRLPHGFPADLHVPGDGPAHVVAKAGRLFVADYHVLKVLQNSKWHELPRFVSKPRALFAATAAGFVPVAIQCDPDGHVFRPSDGAHWELAKHVVQVADGNHHELVSHLSLTHLLVELFLMATRRHLAPNHPLSRLLLPHFEGTVFINDKARTSLIADGGAIDRIFAGEIETARRLSIEALATLDWSTYDLPTRTQRRRTEAIAVYPWRDDALLVWKQLATFVDRIVARAYPDQAAFANDTELAAWSAQLSRPIADGGVPRFDPPRDRQALARTLTLIIYTASAQHAAVNFAQYPLMSFAALVAGAGWASPPLPGQPPADLMDFLPPRQLALQQLDVLFLLSSVHYTQLGHYGDGWFGDAGMDAAADALRTGLATVEATIQHANTQRRPYTYLLPSLIPQSINI